MNDIYEPSLDDGRFTLAARPFSALRSGVTFLCNIQKTEHFFRMTDAIDGPQNEANYQRFIKTPVGEKLDGEGVNFAHILSDSAMLNRQPPGSLARAYLDFLSAEDLQMDMLMGAERDAASSNLQLDESRRNYMESGIALHDVLHVLTGYGRDAVGEACVLAFTAEQFKLRGVGLFSRALSIREQVSHPGRPILKMAAEARRMGRKAIWIPEVDWREYLHRPVSEVRRALGIEPSQRYMEFYPDDYVAVNDTAIDLRKPAAA